MIVLQNCMDLTDTIQDHTPLPQVLSSYVLSSSVVCWWRDLSPPQDKEPSKSLLNTNQHGQLYVIVDFQNRLRDYFLNSDLLISWEIGSVSTKGGQGQFGFVCGRKILVQSVHAERAVAGLKAAVPIVSTAAVVFQVMRVAGLTADL